MNGPLSGIRVIDFSRVLAGPLCARTLLDLGAEVIKIEPPRPDVSRFAFPSTPGMSGYYAQQNAGKRNVSIDLNVPGARELALRLCDTADVVVENFRAGTLRFFGLDYDTLAARNPRLIYASITGYGQGGPWQGRMAYAPTVQPRPGSQSTVSAIMARFCASREPTACRMPMSMPGCKPQSRSLRRCTGGRPQGQASTSTSQWQRP